MFAAAGTLYAVLLAFMIIVMWENLNTARAATYNEADQLANVYWVEHSLPLPGGAAIDALSLDYAHTVIETEWPLMAKRGDSSTDATHIDQRIRSAVFGFVPRSGQQQVLYQQAVSSVNAFTDARRDRQNEIGDVLPGLLWVVLIIGAVVNVGFCLFFGIENKAMHICMVVGFAGLIVTSLFVIKAMEHPFAGSIRVGPDAFEQFLSHLPPQR